MYLNTFRISNFRRLREVLVNVERDTTIFVGANNSGKTSAAEIFTLFLGARRGDFSIHDFSAHCWEKFDSVSHLADSNGAAPIELPVIELDLWFDVEKPDIHRVVHLLPNLDWKDTPVGVRLRFAPKDPEALIANYREAYANAAAKSRPGDTYKPWPTSLTDYLKKRLKEEFSIQYFVLDRTQFDAEFKSSGVHQPLPLGDATRKGESIIKSLIRVDYLSAQRNQSDTKAQGRTDSLSRRFSKMYGRNPTEREADFEATRALANSEAELNTYLENFFKPTFAGLSRLGYPGVSNPELLIRSVLNPTSILSDSAQIHYVLKGDGAEGGADLVLPDQYNGLGFKNLICMAVEVLDFHAQWIEEETDRALLHLVVIEEPEAHLHTQLQQVFIKNILNVIREAETGATPTTQLMVTTHSPHILYESGFSSIRYFRRSGGLGRKQYSVVLNLSDFYIKADPTIRDFLQRYMKLTHCDLFFADAAILVEGNVERLLMPLMIRTAAPSLQSKYLSILEVGGAFAYVFKELIEFLGQPALVITDIDSVAPPAAQPPDQPGAKVTAAQGDTDDDDDDEAESVRAKACISSTVDAVTSNITLREWLPKLSLISELFAAQEQAKTQAPTASSPSAIRVAYQVERPITWKSETKALAGRTLEEDFALENLAWCQQDAQKDLNLKIPKADQKSLEQICERIFNRVKSSSFRKTDFALMLMMRKREEWQVPAYIVEGLKWLSGQLPDATIPQPQSKPAEPLSSP